MWEELSEATEEDFWLGQRSLRQLNPAAAVRAESLHALEGCLDQHTSAKVCVVGGGACGEVTIS